MLSKIQIDANFNGGQPFIRVTEDLNSTDLKDKAVWAFREALGGVSRWCSISFLQNGGNEWLIHPIPVNDLHATVKEIQQAYPVSNFIPNNSEMFEDYLKSHKIDFLRRDHGVLVDSSVNLFDLGFHWQSYIEAKRVPQIS